jgi:putative oxidoreductase
MKRYQNLGLAILRIGISSLMIRHGFEKFQELFILAEPVKFWMFTGKMAWVMLFLAMFGELIAPIFIILGYKTRWAAVPAVITMAVAAFVYHAGHPIEKMEHSLLYLIGFMAVWLCGPGEWSIDGRK